MKVTVSSLRRIIREAVVDKMRLPRGPNSRDDAEDHELEDDTEAKDNINIETSKSNRG
jgi:hypothetical protein